MCERARSVDSPAGARNVSAFCLSPDFRQNAPPEQQKRVWYFAYGSNLNTAAVTEWCRHYGHKPPGLRGGRAAVLDNYRLCFPIFNEYWGGGTADIVYDPGKYVAGAIFEVTAAEMNTLDEKIGRKLDPAGRDIGIYKHLKVKVAPLGKGDPVEALTYTGVTVEKYHIPPTKH